MQMLDLKKKLSEIKTLNEVVATARDAADTAARELSTNIKEMLLNKTFSFGHPTVDLLAPRILSFASQPDKLSGCINQSLELIRAFNAPGAFALVSAPFPRDISRTSNDGPLFDFKYITVLGICSGDNITIKEGNRLGSEVFLFPFTRYTVYDTYDLLNNKGPKQIENGPCEIVDKGCAVSTALLCAYEAIGGMPKGNTSYPPAQILIGDSFDKWLQDSDDTNRVFSPSKKVIAEQVDLLKEPVAA